MITITDLMPFAGTIFGGFFVGLLTGYAIKKIIKVAAVITGLFIAGLAYFEYQQIIDVNWVKIQAVSQNDLTWVENTIVHISNNIGEGHTNVSASDFNPLMPSVGRDLCLARWGARAIGLRKIQCLSLMFQKSKIFSNL